jgi:hypothetical protein
MFVKFIGKKHTNLLWIDSYKQSIDARRSFLINKFKKIGLCNKKNRSTTAKRLFI